MRTLSHALLGIIAGLSFAACSQTICRDGSTGQCSENGGQGNADAGGGGAVTCDDPNEVSCSGICVDTDISPSFCGSCETTCDTGQACASGACVDRCDEGQVLCDDTCIDPLTDVNFCGATGTCSGADVGAQCGATTCSGGVCAAAIRYVGTLPGPTTGLWNYGATQGVVGADEACKTIFASPTAKVCTPSDLITAMGQQELTNAVDSAGTPVTSWFAVDPNANGQALQCSDPRTGSIPWTYQTLDQGQGSKYLTVNAGGNISAVINEPVVPGVSGGCQQSRWVACCNP